VISISLGTNAPDAYVESAVQAAAAAGITVVAAAGNDGCNCMLYPAHYPEVLAVGALDSGNQRAGFSSWGSGLDIMAPGSGMTTTTWSAAQPTSGYASNVGGTSFSAPLVAGMVTRLLSAQPDAVPLQLAAALTENTNRLGLVTGIPHDVTIGYGAIDAHKALQRMTTPRVSQNTYVFNPVSRGDYLSGRSITLYPAEKVTEHYRAYQCASGTYGTTTVYESTKPNTSFFTVSPSEQSQSSARGYAVSVFGLVCLEQPHDTVTSVRNLNIFKEFRNDYRKAPDSP
jgi:subtilisin family serine protease